MVAVTFIGTFIKSVQRLGPFLFVLSGFALAAPFYLFMLFPEMFEDTLFDSDEFVAEVFLPILRTGVIFIVGAIILVAKVPERFFPVTFDLLGASH